LTVGEENHQSERLQLNLTLKELSVNKHRLGPSTLVMMLFISFLARSVLAADNYNAAFRSCRVAIAEKFGADETVKMKRKSFSDRVSGYKVFYIVNQRRILDDVEQRYLVKCETNKQGIVVTLDVSPD
jgi:hypothetical protein